jgi:hypothetical protein
MFEYITVNRVYHFDLICLILRGKPFGEIWRRWQGDFELSTLQGTDLIPYLSETLLTQRRPMEELLSAKYSFLQIKERSSRWPQWEASLAERSLLSIQFSCPRFVSCVSQIRSIYHPNVANLQSIMKGSTVVMSMLLI